MKAIIIAAGMGSRLSPMTDDKPKCMIDLNGKPLLEHQISALKGAGVEKIALVKGYKAEMIKYPGIAYYLNDNYANNNILHSLFYAEKEMDDEFMAVYSDIFYGKEIVKRLLESKKDISIVVDIDWREYYEGRTKHPIEEAENVIFDSDNNVVHIGKILPDKDAVHGEFIGMIKCSARGAKIFADHFRSLKAKYSGKPFQRAKVFEKAYLTDMIQDLADNKVPVHCVIIEKGWKEIDTVEDYKKVVRLLEEEGHPL